LNAIAKHVAQTREHSVARRPSALKDWIGFERHRRTALAQARPLLIALLGLFAGSASVYGQTWSWTVETADTNSSVTFTSIASDPKGNLHISYRTDENFGQLKYAFRSATTSKWFTMVLDKQLGSFYSFIALDQKGNPQVCYTPRQMKYASWDGARWNIAEIAPHSGAVEYSCSLVVGKDGKPRVAWYHTHRPDGSFYLHLRYAEFEDGAWLARTVDFDGEAGKWNSLVLDDEGVPHVTYSQFPRGELRFAYWNGKAWTSSIVDSVYINKDGGEEGANRGMGNSLLLNRQKQWTISYYDLGSIKYARQEGDKWIIERVDHLLSASPNLGGWASYRTTQVLDSHGNPHIGYEDAGALKHAYWDGKEWHVQVVLGVTGDTFRYSSMSIDAQDNLYFSYRDPYDGSLKVAIGRPAADRSAAANNGVDAGNPKP
jgi:hypothetical protein